MGFFRAAFACVFFGVSNTLAVIVRRTKHAANTMAFLVKNMLMQDSPGIRTCAPIVSVLSLSLCLATHNSYSAGSFSTSAAYDNSVYVSGYPSKAAVAQAACEITTAQNPPAGFSCTGKYVLNPANNMYYTEVFYWAWSPDAALHPYAPIGYLSNILPKTKELDPPCTSCPCATGKVWAGNPIDANTGNKYQLEEDYTSSNGLSFKRHYQSSVYATSANLGKKWTHNYDRKITSDEFAYIYRPGGKAYSFEPNASNSAWVPDVDITDTLAQLKDAGGNPTGWRYTTSNDEVEIYNAAGKLLSITNRAGLTQTLTYSDGTTGQNGGYVLDATGTPTAAVLPAGLLIRVTDTSSRSLNFGYDASNRIVKMTDPAGGVYLYGYDTNNNLASVTYPDNHKRIYLYENNTAYTSNTNQPHALTGIIDTTAADATGASGTRYASYWYDAQGRAYKEEHAPSLNQGIDKHQLTYNTDANGNPTSTVVTDPLNTARTYNFTTILGVVKSTGTDQPGGSGCGPASSAITFDANGNIASRADFNQHKTCYAYDLARNLETARVEGLASTADCATALAAATLSGDARKTTTVWDTTYRLPHIITEAVGKPEERVTTLTYDATSGSLLSKEIKDTATSKTRTWTYTYTTAADNTLVNLLKTVNGPRTDLTLPLDDTTTYSYYTDTTADHHIGDLKTITNALGHITQITKYDGNGRPLTIVDPNAVTTTLTYWPRGWLKSKAVGSKTTSYDYDNAGQPTRVTLADGSFIQYTHDAAHRLTDISDTLLNRIHYTLDAIGNRIKEEVFDSSNKLTTQKGRDFDALNRLWHDIAYFNDPNTPVATQYTYDANGNLTTVTAPANSGTDTTYRTTTFSYDALNRLTNVIDPLNPTKPTQYSFDGLDQVKTITDPRNLITGYTTNALGDTTQQVSTDPGTTNRTFDEAGNVKTETNAKGIQASYSYDALNRLISASYPALGENITLSWDSGTGCTYGIGHVCQVTSNSGTLNFAYDDQGNRIKKTRTVLGVSQTTQYTYDGANRLYTEIPPTSRTLTLGRNTAGQINTVSFTNSTATTTLEKQITYDGAGQVTSQTLGNGVILKASYDLSGQPVSERANKHDGDINQDGVVNVVDMLFALRIAEGLMTPTQDQLDHADVAPSGNPDGKIDVRDVNRIIRKKQGLENF